MNKTSKNTKGFTLSEVLIALGIVGIIATMTIPALMKSASDKETVTKVNNIYSTLSAATNKIVNDEGPISGWDFGDSASRQMDAVVNSYKKQLVFIKSCAYGILSCYPFTWKVLNGNSWGTMSGSVWGYHNILQDGTFVYFEKCFIPGTQCEFSHISNENPKMLIWVDVN